MTTLEGKVAVVTGGGSGIGRALALALARERARVVVADVSETDAAETVRQVAAAGAEGLAIRTDVSDRRQVEALADRVFDRYGATHVLCNNAGVVVHGGLEAATWEDWQWVVGVNLWGVVHGLLAFVPRMVAGGEGGHVVNTASMAGLDRLAGAWRVQHHQVRRRRALRDASRRTSAPTASASPWCVRWVSRRASGSRDAIGPPPCGSRRTLQREAR